MSVYLTPEQERRIQAIVRRGAYKNADEVLEAALAAVEQRALPGFSRGQENLDALLAEGMASGALTEDEFWTSVIRQTDGLVAKHRATQRS
jgi:putative addiction module CopG family antidote